MPRYVIFQKRYRLAEELVTKPSNTFLPDPDPAASPPSTVAPDGNSTATSSSTPVITPTTPNPSVIAELIEDDGKARLIDPACAANRHTTLADSIPLKGTATITAEIAAHVLGLNAQVRRMPINIQT